MQEFHLVKISTGIENSERLPTKSVLATFYFSHVVVVHALNMRVGRDIAGRSGQVVRPHLAAVFEEQQVSGCQNEYLN
jgi:hypothetical protein